jgi:hypothetical protein
MRLPPRARQNAAFPTRRPRQGDLSRLAPPAGGAASRNFARCCRGGLTDVRHARSQSPDPRIRPRYRTFLVIVPGIIMVRAPEMDVLASAFFREWCARLDSRRPAVVRRTTNHCAPPTLVERDGDLDFPIRLVSGASRLGALGRAATVSARRYWRARRRLVDPIDGCDGPRWVLGYALPGLKIFQRGEHRDRQKKRPISWD